MDVTKKTATCFPLRKQRACGMAALLLLSASAFGQSFFPPVPIPADAGTKGMWSPVYPWPVISVHSVILPDGRLMTYGSDTTGLQTANSVYDIWQRGAAPDAGHMTLPNNTGVDIFCSSQLLLPQTGTVFIAGGDQWLGTRTATIANDDTTLFDPASLSLTKGSKMLRKRWYSTSTTLINGEVYVQGGTGGADRAEVRSADGSFRVLSGFSTGSLPAFYPRNWVAPDGRLFGYTPDNGVMYWIDPSGAGRLTMAGSFNAGYTGGWYSSAAMYRPGHILQIGGNSNGAYTIDITSGTPLVAATQSMSTKRAWVNATLLADGQVVATSGSEVVNEADGFNNTAEIWNPVSGQWTQGAVAQKMRLYHSNAILLPDGSVLTSGGGAGQPTLSPDPNKNNLSAEIYYPPYFFTPNGQRASRPVITNAPDYVDIGRTYGVTVSGATSVSRVTFVKTGSASHSFNFDQRFLELVFRAGEGGLVTIQAPARAAEATPGFYYLFVFDQAGVPSEAKIVRLGIATDPNPSVTPTIINPGAQTSVVGTSVDLTLRGGDPNGDVIGYGAAGLPPGLTLDGATGRITGTLTMAGSYNVVVSTADGVNASTASFAWTVRALAPLTLEPPPPPPLMVLQRNATYTARATGGADLRYQWNFGDGVISDWSSSPTITHRYPAAGTYTVTISITDSSGLVQSRSFRQAIYLPSTPQKPAASSNLLIDKPAGGDARLWVVNQDNDSITGFNAQTLVKLSEVPVGAAPRAIARASNGLLWVTNKRSASISIVDPAARSVARTIALPRGSQPFGVVAAPNAAVVYVALEASGQLLRFDSATYTQTGSLAVGANARHLSVTADGKSIYVSRFVTPPLPGEGTARVTTDASVGAQVLQVDAATFAIVRTIVLQHGEKPDAENQGRGIPNYLGPATISPDGTQAWLPSKLDNIKRGMLRDGTALDFQNTVRAISSRISLVSQTEDIAARIDHDNASLASAVAYDARGVHLFVALETSREVAVLNAFSGEQLFRINVGRAPQGLALSVDGRRLFVHNFMDRTVGVFDVGPLLDRGVFALPEKALLSSVTTEALAPDVLRGKQFFYDAADTRLARDKYMSCASCHNDGGHDGRVWDFTGQGEGLRNTIALRGRAGIGQGFLHWSGNFDEAQDFEGQIRTLAGGTGLMGDADFAAGTRAQPLGARKAGVSSDLDALNAYLASLSSFDPAPARPSAESLSVDAQAGRAVFDRLRCAACHAGAGFTNSSPGKLVDIGTLKVSSGRRLGGRLAGVDVPTLRDVWATPPYLHDGSAATLEEAVRAHRNATIGNDDLIRLGSYLREIGSDEPAPRPIPSDSTGPGNGTGLSALYFPNRRLGGLPLAGRVEAVDFDWGSSSPAFGIGSDNFSVRWLGTLRVGVTGEYRFETIADDGVRLWVNGVQVIDDWSDHGPRSATSAPVQLTAGRRVQIRMEYYERGGGAVVRLRWLTPGAREFVPVPKGNLYSG